MSWYLTHDLAEFQTTAGAHLAERPAENTVLLTIVETLKVRGATAFGDEPPLFGWYTGSGGTVEAAILQTPPRLLLLSSTGGDMRDLVRALRDSGRYVPGVIGDPARAGEFAGEWTRLTGARADRTHDSRLYRLAQLTPPDPMPRGEARLADPSDRKLLLDWFAAFHREIGEADGADGEAIDDRLSYGGLWLWEVDGVPVSMAGRTRQVADMIRIAPVYTPPERRRHGYAAGATSAVSRDALTAATEVLLFTDLLNPTSNALYQRLGYRPVLDRVALEFLGE